ncbi:MAG: hypothetical protein JNM19_05470 [Chitinophagaceae bacterium]|nr:hypothetical protein [Chitinophagaceae bacterium]
MRYCTLILIIVIAAATACQHKKANATLPAQTLQQIDNQSKASPLDTAIKSIHVFVALCDNKYQGIVPVSAKVGNGQDPDNNLYWGWGYGIRTFFKNSKEWELMSTQKLDSLVLERLVFKHRNTGYYLIADAYDGRYIKQCTINFLNSLSGQTKDTIHSGKEVIGINGNARLISLIGHNGLMDFQIPQPAANEDKRTRDCIILACISKKYFLPYIVNANAYPALLTSGLMGPEAYTLHDALSAYVKGGNYELMRTNAAKAYSAYTKCSFQAAKNLLVTGR